MEVIQSPEGPYKTQGLAGFALGVTDRRVRQLITENRIRKTPGGYVLVEEELIKQVKDLIDYGKETIESPENIEEEEGPGQDRREEGPKQDHLNDFNLEVFQDYKDQKLAITSLSRELGKMNKESGELGNEVKNLTKRVGEGRSKIKICSYALCASAALILFTFWLFLEERKATHSAEMNITQAKASIEIYKNKVQAKEEVVSIQKQMIEKGERALALAQTEKQSALSEVQKIKILMDLERAAYVEADQPEVVAQD